MKTIKNSKEITTLEVGDKVIFGCIEYIVCMPLYGYTRYYLGNCDLNLNNSIIFEQLHINKEEFLKDLGIIADTRDFPEVKSLEELTAIVNALFKEYEKQNNSCNMNKIEIEIPNDKEIDWETSAKQKQIVFKDKQLTYEDVCIKLFDKGLYFIDVRSKIRHLDSTVLDTISATTKHQLECILAKNKLANVARYLNGELDKSDFQKSEKYIIWIDCENSLCIASINNVMADHGYIIFKSHELAQQAVEILGEETIRLALEPLY